VTPKFVVVCCAVRLAAAVTRTPRRALTPARGGSCVSLVKPPRARRKDNPPGERRSERGARDENPDSVSRKKPKKLSSGRTASQRGAAMSGPTMEEAMALLVLSPVRAPLRRT